MVNRIHLNMRSQYPYCIIPGNGKCTSLFSILVLNREEFLAISLSKQGLPFFSFASSAYLPVSLMSAFLKAFESSYVHREDRIV